MATPAATPVSKEAAAADAAPSPPDARRAIASFPPPLATNPYQSLLYEQLAAHGYPLASEARLKLRWLIRARREVGFLHFHWAHGYYQAGKGPTRLRGALSWLQVALFGARLVAARMLGYRIVWTIHQVWPHESRTALDRAGRTVLARAASLLLAHDAETARQAASALGRAAAEAAVVPHGSYGGVYAPGRPRAAVRAELGIEQDALAFLCFGDLRGYKDVELLLQAFRRADLDAALVVAGAARRGGAAEAVGRAADADHRIRALLDFVPDDRVAELFGACDAAVLARGDGGTSGALILALSLGIPVVAARCPVYVDLVGPDEAAGWLFEPGSEESLAGALARVAAASPQDRAAKADAALQRAQSLSWPEIGRRVAALLDGLPVRTRSPLRTEAVS
jgi:beta-1,4-mannosyltransferase